MERHRRFDAIIIGAGIAGLTCAYRLAYRGIKVLVVDRQAEPGGVIRSQRVNGYLLEFGPNTISTSRRLPMEFIAELGIRHQLQSRAMNDHTRYIWRNNRLSAVPGTLSEFIETDLLSFPEKIAAARGLFKRLPSIDDDLPVGSYFRCRVGDGAVNAMLKPAIAGVYAADADRISLGATFPRIAEEAKHHTRLISVFKSLRKSDAKARSPRMMASFDDGLQTLPQTIATSIIDYNGEIALNTSSRIIENALGDPYRWSVELSDGRVGVSDHVIVATSAGAASELLKPHSEEAAVAFSSIDYAPLTIIHAGAKEDQFRVRRNGFGFLAARHNGVRALGILWNDRLFDKRAPKDHRLLTCFYGGELDPDIPEMPDKVLKAHVQDDLERTMGFSGQLDFCQITRWKGAIPLFRVGHRELIQKAIAKLSAGIFVIGNYTGDPSIPGRMESAMAFADKLADSILCPTSAP